MRSISQPLSLCFILVTLAIALACGNAATLAQEPATDAKPVAAKKAKKPRGRLPNHYAAVVTDAQRKSIYQIQAEYAPKIAELKAQLAAMTKQRDEQIEALLSAEQLQQLRKLEAEAKARRQRKKAEKTEPPKPAS